MKTDFLKTKKDITHWLDQYKVKNYTLVEDPTYGYVVNVREKIVDLSNKKLQQIPVKFNEISGNFLCNSNQLTTLDFCPSSIGERFYCGKNKLTSLEFCPSSVGSNFYCQENELTSLEFCPTTVGGGFDCSHNQLTTLEFCPTQVNGSFYCDNNRLTSLEYCPREVIGGFYCGKNNIISLAFCPNSVGGHFDCRNNSALEDIQNINNFAKIFNLHEEIVRINKEKKTLRNQLAKIASNEDLVNKSILKI